MLLNFIQKKWGKPFPKPFIISNVFLIKSAVVVLLCSSWQIDTVIPLFPIRFFIFSLDLFCRKLLRSFNLCLIALDYSLFIIGRWLPGVYFFLNGACLYRLLTHISMKLLITLFQVLVKDNFFARSLEICDYKIYCNSFKFLF